MPKKLLDIAGRKVGPGLPCYVIAEAGINHNGSLERALQLIDAAAEARADAVKFQTFKTIRLVSATAPQAAYQQRNTGSTETQREMLQRMELSPEDHRKLLAHCQRRGIQFLSTPFDDESADLLDELNVPAFKISSGDVTNLPFLEYVAAKGKPMIVSTGMCSLGEVETAVETLERAGAEFALLHCVSNYPADPQDVNLRALHTLAAAFDAPTGYSDHTLGTCVSVASVALGACIVEKHFTLDRKLPGPDHLASLEPAELKVMVRDIRIIEQALGSGRKQPAASERNTAEVARKSLVAAQDIPPGTVFTKELIAIKRPGAGLPPAMRAHVLNRTARRHIPEGSLIRLEDVA
jgi:N-acetylneuraminate synthase